MAAVFGSGGLSGERFSDDSGAPECRLDQLRAGKPVLAPRAIVVTI